MFNMRIKILLFLSFVVLFFVFVPVPSRATYSNVRENQSIEGAPGFRCQNIRYELDYITFDIVNSAKENLTFSGTMTFLDLNARVIAQTDLLPKRFAAGQRLSYKCYFTMGSCEEARRSQRIVWKARISK